MSERGQVDVVVHVEACRFSETLRCVFLAVVGELCRRNAKISVVNTSQAFLPKGIAVLVHLDLTALDDAFHIRVGHSRKFVEVRQGVAMHGASGHLTVGNETIVLDGVKHITEGSTLREGDVAVGTDSGLGTG